MRRSIALRFCWPQGGFGVRLLKEVLCVVVGKHVNRDWET